MLTRLASDCREFNADVPENDLEREAALAALVQSERKLSDFFEQAAMPLHWVGADGTILRANQAELDLLGYSRDEYVGHHIAEFHADGPVIEDILGRLGANETLRDYGARLRHKDGSLRDVLIDSSVLWEDGEFVHTRCFTRDVTARKAAETQLVARTRQQAAVADLGQRALAGTDLPTLLHEAVAMVAATLGVEYAKVLELEPHGRALLLRAGVGWRDGLVGQATVDAGADSQAGYTLLTDEPVIVVDLRTETRFSGPPLLCAHGVVSGLNTIVRGRERPYGVLSVHTTASRVFTEDDVAFLQSVANVLAAEIGRQQAEEALREARPRALIGHAHDLVSVVDADAVVRYVSPAAEEIFGIAPAELVGDRRSDLLHPDDQERSRTHFAAVVAQPGPHPPIELRFKHRDGSWRWLELRMTNRLDDPTIAGVVVNSRDITERTEAEARLRRSEAGLAQAERLVHVGSWELELATNEVTWSAESYRIFGLDPASTSLTQERFFELIHPDDRAGLRAAGDGAMAGDGAFDHEFRINRSDGTERIVHTQAEVIRGSAGVVIGLRGAHHDVTAQRHAEAALRASEARHRAMVETAVDAIVTATAAGTIATFNPGAERMFGYSAADAIGQPLTMLMPERFRGPHLAGMGRYLSTDESRVLGGTVELVGRRRDGVEFPLELSLGRVEDGSGRFVTGILRDITERKVAEATLAASETRFRAMVQNSSDLITVTTAGGQLLYESPAIDQLLGYNPAERAGESIFDLIHPDDQHRAEVVLARVLAHPERPATIEVRLRHRDGTDRHVETILTNLLADPNVGGIVGNTRDVTERKVAEDARRLALAAWRRSFDALPDHLCILDRSGTILQANKTMRDRFEPVHGDLIGLDYRLCYCGTATPEVQPPCVAVLAGGPAVGTEMQLATMPGWYHVASYPIDIDRERQGAISVVRDITDRKEAEDALAYLALHDPLTDLPNRRLFDDRLARALDAATGSGEGVAVLLLDLDRFKVVNDSLGHAAGDELLVAAGRRLTRVLRRRDTLARFGGDEFVVLLDGVGSEAEAVATGERLVGALRAPFRVSGQEVYVGGSVGVACHDGVGDHHDLVRQADAALHRAKAAGRGAVAVYDPTMGAAAVERQALETELRRALARGELVLHYQPKVELATGRIVGCLLYTSPSPRDS